MVDTEMLAHDEAMYQALLGELPDLDYSAFPDQSPYFVQDQFFILDARSAGVLSAARAPCV